MAKIKEKAKTFALGALVETVAAILLISNGIAGSKAFEQCKDDNKYEERDAPTRLHYYGNIILFKAGEEAGCWLANSEYK